VPAGGLPRRTPDRYHLRADVVSPHSGLYHSLMSLMSGLLASKIELTIGRGCCPARSTMPADLFATPSYRVMNADRLGIAADKAERASWRASEAYRYNLPAGFMVLATVPPPPERAGGWSMLVMGYDPRDGTGTQLRGAWWLGPEFPAQPIAAFSKFVARFGRALYSPVDKGIFFLGSAGDIPPQPTGPPEYIDLHAVRQPAGWAWCFGIDVPKHRGYLQAMEASR
jgi:hypothetical protein